MPNSVTPSSRPLLRVPKAPRVGVVLSDSHSRYIADLRDLGLFGETPQEVVTYLISRALQDLIRDGILQVRRFPIP